MDRLERDKLRREPLGIGEMLREARERRRVSLEQAAQETRIRSGHLLALEEEDFSELPAPVFTRGLLRTYCRYLGLNEEQVTSLLDDRRVLSTVAGVRPEAKRLRGAGTGAQRTLALVATFVTFVGLAYYLYAQYTAFLASEADLRATTPIVSQVSLAASTPSPRPTTSAVPGAATPTSLASPAASTPIPAREAVSTPTPKPVTTALPVAQTLVPGRSPTPGPTRTPTPAQTITVEARFTGDCWIHVEVDDKLVGVETLHAGDRRVWTGRKVYLWVGNGAAVNVTFNGKSLGPLGAQGQVVHTTWTAS